MPTLFVKFSLVRHEGFPPPTVAAAVDLDSDNRASDDELIQLTRAKLTWTGTAKFTAPTSVDGLAMMFTFTANPGARFDIEVRLNDSEGKIVAQVHDFVTSFPEARFVFLKEK